MSSYYRTRRNVYRDFYDDWPYESRIVAAAPPSYRRHRTPPVLVDQDFGMGLQDEDLMLLPSHFDDLAVSSSRRMHRGQNQGGASQIVNDDKQFKVRLDVNQFDPEEIQVRTLDDKVVSIEAKHEEKMDDHGYVSRQFSRKYVLPEGLKTDDIETNLSRDGVLTISVPKKLAIEGKAEKKIPIRMIKESSSSTSTQPDSKKK